MPSFFLNLEVKRWLGAGAGAFPLEKLKCFKIDLKCKLERDKIGRNQINSIWFVLLCNEVDLI